MTRTAILSSPANPLLKDVRKAILRGGLTDDGLAVAETFHLLEEALRSDCQVPVVLAAAAVRSAVESHVRNLNSVRVAVVPDALFQKISATEATQGVIALVKPPEWSLEQLFRGRSLVVVLDGIQDPGNAGAIVRSAEAFGATGVIFLKGAVSLFHPKTLRASAGSLFRVPFVHSLDAALARAAIQQNKVDYYAAVPRSARTRAAGDADLTRRCAFVIGSEGRGVSEAMHAGATDLAVPTTGVESLNAGVAASILLYEARRQRSAK